MTWFTAMAIVLGGLLPQGGVQNDGGGAAGLRLVAVTTSSDTVRVGELFTVAVRVRMSAGATLYAPDTLPGSSALETRRSARWQVRSAPGDSVEVELSWVLAAYRTGPLALPAIPLAAERRDGADGVATAGVAPAYGSVLPGGGHIRPMTGPRADRAGNASLQVHARGVMVASLRAGATTAPLTVAGPADVIGPGWNSWRVLLIGVLGLTFLALAGAQAMRVAARLRGRAASNASGAHSPFRESSQHRALRELDEILAQGLHRQHRVDEFYASSALTVRSYVESFDARWNRAFTTRELVKSLTARVGGNGVSELSDVLRMAEVVKFGRLRPDELTAERDWRAMREWVHEFTRVPEP